MAFGHHGIGACAHRPYPRLALEQPTPPVGQLQKEHIVGTQPLPRDLERLTWLHDRSREGAVDLRRFSDVDV